jgi:hypothetical protein
MTEEYAWKPQYKNGDRIVHPVSKLVYERRNDNWVLVNPPPKASPTA